MEKNYRFVLDRYNILLLNLSKYVIYCIVDRFYGTKYHFVLESNPEEMIIRHYPIVLLNQKALDDLRDQIPVMNDFYPQIMEMISHQFGKMNLESIPIMDSYNYFSYKKKPNPYLQRLLKSKKPLI